MRLFEVVEEPIPSAANIGFGPFGPRPTHVCTFLDLPAFQSFRFPAPVRLAYPLTSKDVNQV